MCKKVFIDTNIFISEKFMLSNHKFEKLKTPMVKVMAKVATIKMIAERGDFEVDDLIRKIDAFINKDKK